jgi:hypothetical protein
MNFLIEISCEAKPEASMHVQHSCAPSQPNHPR